MRRLCQTVRYTQTSHAMPCHREEDHGGICSFADGNGHHLWIDAYEHTNLRALLTAIHDAPQGSPLHAFNTGDWFAQLREKLREGYFPHNPPNSPPEQLLERFDEMLKRSLTK